MCICVALCDFWFDGPPTKNKSKNNNDVIRTEKIVSFFSFPGIFIHLKIVYGFMQI